MNRSRSILFVVLFVSSLQAQSPVAPKSIVARRLTSPISIDGKLSEPEWRHPGTSDFMQRDPIEGAEPSQKTDVWVAYDDEALYVGARMHDTSPDSIVARIGRRDAEINADWFYLSVDSYHDKRNAFYFGVSAGGAIQDGTFYNDEWSDESWDGVWDATAKTDSGGWVAEFRIPYSQLRFAKLDDHVWGINFLRIIDRRKEEDYFVMVPKKESGFVSRHADLVGIRNITPPPKLEILPYAAAGGKFLQHEPGDPFNDGSVFTNNIGADLKWGIGTNLTLNATFNPDFGQVEVDPAVVNLTQYETFFEEKRPFFVEGSSFFQFGRGGANNTWGFNWGNPSFFYSRRIGRPPRGEMQHAGFTDIPDRTHILGAAKLTGKVANDWSIGMMHAVTAREYGKVDSSGVRFSDVVEPLAYNGVLRTLREFDAGRQAIGMIGAMTLRDLNQPYLVDNFNRRAFAFGVDGWTNLDQDQTYALTGWLATSRIEGTSGHILALQTSSIHYFQRPDASHVSIDSTATSLTGYAGRVAVNRQKGNFRLNAALGFITPGFNSNDLGFLFQTDRINIHVVVGYQWFDPDGVFRRKGFNVATFRNYNFGGTKVGDGYFLFYGAQLMNYWGIEGNVIVEPGVLDDAYTRGGPLVRRTSFYGTGQYIYSDSRKPVVLRYELFAGRSESGGYRVSMSPSIEWKLGSGVTLKFSPEFTRDVTIAQWAIDPIPDTTATATYGARYVFAKLDQKEISGSIRLDWTFTPKLSLQLFVQPLVSVGRYTEFKELKQPGTYTFNNYGEGSSTFRFANDTYTVDPDGAGPSRPFTFDNPDFNFKSLRGNAVLRWEYLPGSTIYVVWTQERTNLNHPGDYQFGRDISNIFSSTPNNVLLLKVTYWLNP